MLDYLNPILLYGGFGACLLLYIAIFRNWKQGIYLIVLSLPFIGVVITRLNSQLPLLAIDLVFVLATYISFFAIGKGEGVFARIPSQLILIASLFSALVLAQCFNPHLYNKFVALIGIRVWLLYIPLIFVGMALARRPEDLRRLFLVIVLTSVIPCGLGVYQWLSCSIYGYKETMTGFYGDQAFSMTQGFESFEFGTRIYRIPSTFRYVVQYSNYTLAIVAISFAMQFFSPSSFLKKNLARVCFYLSTGAALLSGARAMFVFVPMLLMLIYWFYRNITGVLRSIFILWFVGFCLLFISDLDLIKIFDSIYHLFFHYGDKLVKGGIMYSVAEFPFGKGTGMNTGPARHMIPEGVQFDTFENYYAKAIIELGIFGGILLFLLFISIIIYAYRTHRGMQTKKYRATSSALFAYMIVMMINSFKGWPLDLTPSNIYFWLFIGVQFGLKEAEDLEIDSKVILRVGDFDEGVREEEIDYR